MRPGKLTNEQLQRIILAHLGPNREDVLMSAGVGEDCAAIRFGQEACVLSTDPITAASSRMGRLAVQVSLNDVAASGAEPLGVLLTVLAPPNASIDDIERVIREAAQEAALHKLQIIGGHTEVTDAVNRMVVSSTVVGRAPVERLVRAGGSHAGDVLVMSKSAGIEGTAILACDAADRLLGTLTEEDLREARGLAEQVSVLKEGRIAALNGATAMHDATEGGVLGAAWELAEASGLGLRIDQAAIPVHPVTRKICAALGIDPLRLISSGVMLMAHPEGMALCEKLCAQGIRATVIGQLLPSEAGKRIVCNGDEGALLPPDRDEIYRVVAEASV